MKVEGAVCMLLLAMAMAAATGIVSTSGERIRKSNADFCAVKAGISSHCTDIQLDESGIMLSATCTSRPPWNATATVTGFNLAKFIANDGGKLHVHPCNIIFGWRHNCDFQDSCADTALVDGRLLSTYCNDGNGLFMHNLKDLDLYLGVTEVGKLGWACFWPWE